MSKPPPPPPSPEAVRFRNRLLAALALVVVVTVAGVVTFSRSQIARETEQRYEREFQAGLALLHTVQQVRHATLVERCRTLARKARIVAALEDGAVDLLYLSAQDELRDLLAGPVSTPDRPTAQFYRFLDAQGQVIRLETPGRAGLLPAGLERRLSLPAPPAEPLTGYLPAELASETNRGWEVIALPIHSLENGTVIAALVLGFAPMPPQLSPLAPEIFNAIWTENRLLPAASGRPVPEGVHAALAAKLAEPEAGRRLQLEAAGEDWLVFRQPLAAAALFGPVEEVSVFPLAAMHHRQREAGWWIAGVGAAVLLAGLGASWLLSASFAIPVGRLAHDSREQRAGRVRAEAALESTSAELARAARFSANASHQLKTPVAVLRAGLEVLQKKQEHAAPFEADEIPALIHQTFRVSSVIEDLLLLSRMDAGQLQLKFVPVSLSGLMASALDDLSALPEENNLKIEADCPANLAIEGEKRYTALILQNLLENARKYNRPDGRIRLAAQSEDGVVTLTVGNTALRPIPAEVREHIFERFHRGGMGENVPGYGLGLNLARELARIHGGDLRLLRSDEEWTEFSVTFRAAAVPTGNSAPFV